MENNLTPREKLELELQGVKLLIRDYFMTNSLYKDSELWELSERRKFLEQQLADPKANLNFIFITPPYAK